MKPELAAYFLVGPTAAGKSAVAHGIAGREGYEILSADSMLVYAGLDVGTAKPSGEDRTRVRYHGLDLVTPDRGFSVWEYRCRALEALRDAAGRGRRVIVVGGTGLYVKALIEGLASRAGADPSRRARWNAMLAEQGVGALQEALRRQNPGRYELLADKQNARRLIRALEETEAGAEGPARTWAGRGAGAPLAGLTAAPPLLNRRIEARVEAMFRAGLVEEVRGLLARYPELSPTARQAIGYAEAMDLLAGRCSLEQAVQQTTVRTRQLAKRQRTWFRHQAQVEWIEIGAGGDTAGAAARVMEHWSKHGPTAISG